MKPKTLRNYLKTNSLSKEYTLRNCEVVIDGNSLFNEFLYKSSRCQYLYGCECDVYGQYLKKRLNIFIESNVKCYKMHDRLLKSRAKITVENVSKGFYDPIFFNDVNAEVFHELGIKIFTCEYDPREAIFSVARRFNCPVITNKLDHCLYGVSCIPVEFLRFDAEEKSIKCNIYDKEDCTKHFKLDEVILPLFIMFTVEESVPFKLLSKLFTFSKNNLIPALVTWLNSQGKDIVVKAVTELFSSIEQTQSFMNTLNEVSGLITCTSHLAEKYFVELENHWSIFKDDPMWFQKAVSFRKIVVPYINLKYKQQFSGCWQLKETSIWEIEKSWSNASDKVLFETITERNKFYGRKLFRSTDAFNLFIQETMPGFNHNKLFTLHFVKGAYSVLLSYIILNPVARGVRIFKGNSKDLVKDKNLPAHKDCEKVDKSIQGMFKLKDMGKFDRSVLHDFGEFQHCLQHMNYLNKICGEKIKCTKFHTTYNGTFVYNIYQVNDPIKVLTQFIGRSYVCMWYKKLFQHTCS
ncbi:hypothetical protein K1T71_009922 [Dendrolimus kikuchii]|uniref:Uncharacterized protein n=1 Tax=Dendrolimus kikuchii TaxID=765133 RepID=A0ACC1CT32_9NEOP|nr:hypothetical protein K1T71_009922 [Dendrolimus kikuchii]